MSHLLTAGILQQARNLAKPSIPIDNMIAWYNADNVIESGGAISQLVDISGNGYNANSGANKAALIQNSWNGKPVIRFTRSQNNYYRTAPFGPYSQPNTLFVVWKKTFSDFGTICDGLITTSVRNGLRHSGLQMNAFAGGGVAYDVPAPFSILSTIVYNGGSSSIFENGVLKNTGNIGALANGGLTIGTLANEQPAYALEGDLAEIIIYNNLFTDSERQQIESYLMTKYAL
jgi:hypothetical protein